MSAAKLSFDVPEPPTYRSSVSKFPMLTGTVGLPVTNTGVSKVTCSDIRPFCTTRPLDAATTGPVASTRMPLVFTAGIASLAVLPDRSWI
jgi:hypothetical protein